MQKFDVLIVGAGMVGLTLALALRKTSQLTIALVDTQEVTALDNNIDVRVSAINVASKKILVVDDSLTARRHIARVLENIGVAQLLFAENGQQALDLLEQHEVDLVITDYNMPVMDGAAFIEALRQHPRFSNIPALMVTSENNGAKLDGVRQSGVSALVDKPFDIDAVKQVLGRLFETAA